MGDLRMQSVVSNPVLGTRAVTTPLSPLPGGPEKEMSLLDLVEGRLNKFKKFWKKLMCWR
jgi:GTPase KRas